MKKRKVKDFIALYAPEDEEKLVLIQSGTSADKTFLDTFWTAHTHALAMVDVQTGQVLSGRCCLSWPLTDKERESGDYSKRFAKGNIYRIKTRGWKGDALSEPEWLADNDQTDRAPEKDPITEEEFARRILITEFTVSPGGGFTAWYEDDYMFWGHVVTVDGTLKKGPISADMQG